MATVAVVGAGWTGAACARELTDAGVGCEVFERSDAVAGHARASTMNGVLYEPNGPHIFHTSNPVVHQFVTRFGMRREYHHGVKSAVEVDSSSELVVLSWPPQLDELDCLPQWPAIVDELDRRPQRPDDTNFETRVVSLMGETLYRLFVYGYTVKQWGCEPDQLSARVAQRGIALRHDGERRLFRDTWEFWPPNGANEIIENMLDGIPVAFDRMITMDGGFEALERDFDAVVVTAPLDELLGRSGALAWRGISTEATYFLLDAPDRKRTAAYTINQPSPRVPYTRTVETKWASGQLIDATVVAEEYPGAPFRHYPVATPGGEYEALNLSLQREVAAASTRPVFFCGRLANYQYIDQDEAIAQGLHTARQVLDRLRSGS